MIELQKIWYKKSITPQSPVSEVMAIKIIEKLALLVPNWVEQNLYEQQLAATVNPDRRERLQYLEPLLDGDAAARDSFFQALLLVENRATEPWVVDAVALLHHPLRNGASIKYVRPSLELLEEIQRTGDIFFPRQFIGATLGYYQEQEVVDIVDDFLTENPDFPVRLRNKVEMGADLLRRRGTSGR